ncbi:MAG: fimbrillin family protein [Prevotella sp.]|nr:fimbrillin family protein [Prevotella sp.]
MRRKQTLWMMMAAGTALTGLTACQNGDDGAPAGTAATAQRVEIRLAASVGAADDGQLCLGAAEADATASSARTTRSFDATNLQAGDTCYVWADMVNGSTQEVTDYFKAWTLIADGNGGLSPQQNGNTKLFPATNVLNFYALVGNFGRDTEDQPMVTPETQDLPTEGITHTVLADQTTAGSYYKSDLLYAVKAGQEPISEAVVLPLQHLLCRIQVVLVAGNGMTTTDLSEATVKLLSLERRVLFTPDKSKDASVRTNLADMLVAPNPVKKENITMATNVIESVQDAAANVYADAIVVPQTIAEGTPLIHVSYMGRDTYYNVPEGGLELKSGKQYRFRLIADRIGASYSMTPTVGDWTAEAQDEIFVEN